MLFCVVRELVMDNLDCLLDWIYNFIMKENYTQASHYFPTIAFHIEITPLADGMYGLIQEPDGDISEAQANIVELTEVSNPDSEETKASDTIDSTEGKPQCIILNYATYYYLCI